MLLRWLIREDELDLGLWARNGRFGKTFDLNKTPLASHLVIPLDTHTGRISQYLGLTKRKNLNWKAAQEVTSSLRKIDSADPVKFDFALARLGILDLCQKKYRAEICEKCELLPACKFARRRSKRKNQ